MATVQDISTQKDSGQLLDVLLQEQQNITAVERFSQKHAKIDEPLLGSLYRDLIPLTQPRPGEQYAFEVDLDACSGCKACVAACHNLNGLDENEHWRSVGLLHGGDANFSLQQHVTSACHHCLEPGCLTGCPVKAYEKDPITGIVRHLDDQCFGCQYCILMCPYEVPQYSASRGIVRKCDMCRERLTEGEAPACVQACPTHAIKIRSVEIESIKQKSLQNDFLPTTPDATITCPTTFFKTKKPEILQLQSADRDIDRSQHSHLALVIMLVLTQLSVGTFLASHFFESTIETAAIALLIGIIGINSALLHLGRPQYAYRALLGLRSSWLSREILAFGIFASLASSYVGVLWLANQTLDRAASTSTMGWLTSLAGIVAIFCSAMIYAKTKRPYWTLPRTLGKFLLTTALLGFSSFTLLAVVFQLNIDFQSAYLCLMTAAISKLVLESSEIGWLSHSETTPQKKTALLLSTELRHISLTHIVFLISGGVLFPILFLITLNHEVDKQIFPLNEFILAFLVFASLIVSELAERYLFFTASVAPKMPGGPCR